MIDAKEIRAAVEVLDRADDSQWEPNGLPKLSVLKTLLGNDKLTDDDVDEAIGAFKRTDAHASAADVQPAAAPADPEKLDPNRVDKDTARAIVEAATKERSGIEVKIADAEDRRQKCVNEIDSLVVLKDKQSKLIERFSPRVSFADGVKAIQRQTTERLAKIKDETALAQQVLKATGTTVHASALDAAMANRKRSPEQKTNYAKYVHQNATSQQEARG